MVGVVTTTLKTPYKIGVNRTGLSDSGAPILAVMMASGAIAGWKSARKKLGNFMA